MIEARCPVCHRVEQHASGTVTVVVDGGARRPASPAAAAWPALRRVRAGEASLHGPCAACGGPMLGPPGPRTATSWTLTDRADVFEVPLDDGPITGPGGAWSEARLDALFAQRYAPRLESGGWFGILTVLPFFFIVFPWLFAMAFAFIFIAGVLTR